MTAKCHGPASERIQHQHGRFPGTPRSIDVLLLGRESIHNLFGTKAVNGFAESVAAMAASMAGPLAAMGPIPNRDQHQLLITSTALGSFGFELEEYRGGQLTFGGDESAVAQALDQTQRLLRGTLGTDDELADSAAEADRRALDKVRGFLQTLLDNDAVCTVELGESLVAFQDVGQVRTSLARLSQDYLREDHEELRGELQGVLPKARADRETKDPTAEEELGTGTDDEDENEPAPEPEPKQKNNFPASLGMSVLLPASTSDNETIEATVSFAQYVKEERETSDRKKKRTVWRRVPQPSRSVVLPLKPSEIEKGCGLPDTPSIRVAISCLFARKQFVRARTARTRRVFSSPKSHVYIGRHGTPSAKSSARSVADSWSNTRSTSSSYSALKSSVGDPVTRSSATSSATPCTRSSSSMSTLQPRGRAMCLSNSSAPWITRGVIAVERRRLCFL